MGTRRIDGFFYGLFMDMEVLRESGAHPSNPRRAQLDDFALCIGKRATLIPSPGARAYGMLISMTHGDMDRLYTAPGLEIYRPEAVVVHPFEGGATPALCYNLTHAPEPHERNPEYAKRLRGVLEGLEFPAEYVESIGLRLPPTSRPISIINDLPIAGS